MEIVINIMLNLIRDVNRKKYTRTNNLKIFLQTINKIIINFLFNINNIDEKNTKNFSTKYNYKK